MGNSNYLGKGTYNPFDSGFGYFKREEPYKIYDHYTGEPYKVIIRNNRDTNQANDNTTIMFRPDVAVQGGMLYDFREKTYLTLNKESTENDYYFKSDAQQCNTRISAYTPQGKELAIEAYAYDITNTAPISSSMLEVINGFVELITASNEISTEISINSEFTAMGRDLKIIEFQNVNNIMHFHAEVKPHTQKEFTLEINSQENYPTETYYQFTATPKLDGLTITNAEIKWQSSDTTVCQIIQDTGEAYFNSEGQATITATWLSTGITDTKTFNVIADAPLISEITYTGDPEIKEGNTRWKNFTASFKDSSGAEDPDAVAVWEIEFDTAKPTQANFVLSDIQGNVIGLKAKSGTGLAGLNQSYFTLTLKEASDKYLPSSVQIKIAPIY